MSQDRRPYRHLNRDGIWPGFSWDGLELGADGALRLTPLPRFDGVLPPQISSLASVQPPAGIAVDPEGTIFFSDPASAAISRIDGCSGGIEPAPCLGGRGSSPTRLSEPSALLIPTHRRALYVADAGNHRIQVFDLNTLALVDILSGFARPVSLASDDEGNLYVVDTEARRVDQLTLSGDIVPAFWDAVQAGGRVTDPRAVACEGTLIHVLDGQTHHVCVFDARGVCVGEAETSIAQTAVIAVIAGVIYVGDPDRRRIAVVRQGREGAYVYSGDVAGYEGPVAALASDRAGGLLLLPGGGIPPVRLQVDASYRHDGWLRSDAIWFDDLEHYWNRLHARIDLPVDSHVQFFVYRGALSSPPPAATPDDPFPAPWRAAGNDVTDCFLTFDGQKTTALWIGARFTNDLHATPALSQARVDFDQESYLPYLPAIYRDRGCDEFLLRYLSLFESFFDELEAHIDDLPGLLDPGAAPSDALPWLAGFLALALPEVWGDGERREAIAGAFVRYARRGTVAGLLETLRTEAGVRALIDEPLQATGWWGLPAASTSCRPGDAGTWTDGGDSILGFNTVLASAEPQGAVVGTTATLDRSQLIAQDEYGTPLFDDVAYRFTVRLYPGEVTCAGKLDQVKAILDREKPAHTVYDMCVIAPGIRIGYQARLGVDTLLGGGPVPGRLGETALVLGREPRGQVGVRSQVGVSTQL